MFKEREYNKEWEDNEIDVSIFRISSKWERRGK